ncbi:MAG: HEAT repeat domain-containing protein [Planctomycetes bacterium]|nr:HEAT repeat domain-containing protein [Planctomycetota bacterium]
MSRSVKEELADLRECEENPALPDLVVRLQRALQSKNNRTIERAANLIAVHNERSLADDICAAYNRFLVDPLKTDPGCLAKTALVEALRQTEYPKNKFFLEGIHYRQYEPGFGGETDTAAQLRAYCGFALIQQSHPQALSELVDLLTDREKTARAGAARAIAHAGSSESVLLLRLKIALGDPSPEVMGECFAGLLQLDGEHAITRVAQFLNDPSEDLQCEAAIALGETHSPTAFELLKELLPRANSREFERVLLASIGLLSLPEAVDYLLSLVTTEDIDLSVAAIKALSHIRDRTVVQDRLTAVVEKVSHRRLTQALREAFPRPD